MERILLYNVCANEEIIRIASNMRIKCGTIDADDQDRLIKDLASDINIKENTSNSKINQEAYVESMLIFCDVSEKHMDKLLFEIKHRSINITYKAILTPTNSRWTLREMLIQMRRERFEYMRMNMK